MHPLSLLYRRLVYLLFVVGAAAGGGYGQSSGERLLPPEPAAGFYDSSVRVRLPEGVRYTLDGGTPSANSPAYEQPLDLDRTTIVRYARVGDDGRVMGFVEGATYLIGEPATKLMTLSIGIDPWRLFDGVNGWFRAGPGADPGHWKQPGANWWTRKEHPAHLDLIETDGRPVHSSTVGWRMFGGMSRLHPQKSFSISARKRYGDGRINHPVFGDDAPGKFQFLVVRNGGSDWNRSYIRDALMHDLLRDESWALDHQAGRPVQVYLNGKYWGIYHLREKINPQFLADRHDVPDKETIDLLEHQRTVKHGRVGDYLKMLRFAEQADLSDPANYARLGEQIDIPNYQRWQIAQTYFDNRDAGGNIRYWRDRADPDGRWRWILYDVDQGFGLHSDSAYLRNTLRFYAEPNGPSWPNPPWSTLLQRRLLTNAGYRRSFVNRTLDYLATDFSAERVGATIERHRTRIAYDMPRQFYRWKGQQKHWQLHLDRMHRFARERPHHLREHLRDFFAGGDDVEVEITADPGGYVVLNDNLRIDEATHRGSYFANHPLSVVARAHPGFRFTGWEGEAIPAGGTLSLLAGGTVALTAAFEPYEHQLAGRVVINEICPRSGSSGDWLEVYNHTEEGLDLGGWFLTDEANRFALPTTWLPARDHLVVCRDETRFRRAHPAAHNVVSGLSFGLAKGGERLGLYAADGAFVDQAEYRVDRPDSSFVVARVRPELDGADYRNWAILGGPGSPCVANPGELRTAVLGAQDYWLRIGIGGAVLALVILVRVGRERGASDTKLTE